jgi:hypothetical protein
VESVGEDREIGQLRHEAIVGAARLREEARRIPIPARLVKRLLTPSQAATHVQMMLGGGVHTRAIVDDMHVC